MEPRRFTTSPARAAYRAWPGLAPVFALERSVITLKTGGVRAETVYGVTSRASQRAAPSRVLELVRGHWQIEHQSHGVRDVTCAEDRSQVRGGNIPQVMAALRNTNYWTPAVGRLLQHGSGLPPVGCTPGTGVGTHRDSTRKLNDPDARACEWLRDRGATI